VPTYNLVDLLRWGGLRKLRVGTTSNASSLRKGVHDVQHAEPTDEICLMDMVIYCRPSRRHLGGSMLVQRVLTPDSSLVSWTVLGDGGPVEPIERYLAYLTDIEQSPNTIKAYAHDLKDWFVFLAARGFGVA
jgi:Phage integrase, N-terminal SAM-like domain